MEEISLDWWLAMKPEGSSACSTCGTSSCAPRAGTMKLPSDFRDLLEEFARERVEHVILGGYAFGFHVQPRATKDLDLLIEGSAENRAPPALLASYGAPPNVVEATRALEEDEVVYFGQSPLRVDILRSIDGVEPALVFANAISAVWDGTPVRVAASTTSSPTSEQPGDRKMTRTWFGSNGYEKRSR